MFDFRLRAGWTECQKPHYDWMVPAYDGIMPLTGKPEGLPMKVGVGRADVLFGMYASSGILAALRHQDMTGAGQHIDLALVDAHFKRIC